MNVGNFVKYSVFAIIGVLVIISVVGPVITSGAQTHETLDNDGYFHMEKYDTTENITVVWDHTDPNKISVNSEEYVPGTPLNQFVSVLVGDNFYMRYADGGANVYVQATYGGVERIDASTAATRDLTVTCSGGTATITNGVINKTVSYTELYVISGDSGDYVMKNSTVPAYMGADTEFIALGSTAIGEGTTVLKVAGNIEDGATVSVVGSTATTTTTSNVAVNSTELTDYLGYQLSNITFTISADGTDYNATYSYFIVPASVSLELAKHATALEITIMNILPVLMIVGVLLFVVGAFVANRRA